MHPTRRTTRAVLSGAALIAGLAGCAGDAAALGRSAGGVSGGTSVAGTSSVASSSSSAASGTSSGRYANGTYTATGSHGSPAGREDVEVTLTLVDDVVTAVTVTPQAGNRTSVQYQARFASGIAAQVVGVPLDQLDVGSVSGASLTGEGFMAAVDQIAADAAA